MKPYLEIFDMTYDSIGDFIEESLEQTAFEPMFLFGKAAAYVDCAYALGLITEAEAQELLTSISVYMAV